MKIKPKQKNRNPTTSKAPPPNQIIHYHINETTPKPNHPKNRNPARHPTHPLPNQTIIKEAEIGLANGLLCLTNVAEDIAFWNPSIKKHKVFPFLLVDRPYDHEMSMCGARVYGFGYDSAHNDY